MNGGPGSWASIMRTFLTTPMGPLTAIAFFLVYMMATTLTQQYTEIRQAQQETLRATGDLRRDTTETNRIMERINLRLDRLEAVR